MKLSDKLCLYEVLVSIAIFIAIAVVVETYAVRSESRQAEYVTRLLQKELVDNIEIRLDGVEHTLQRISKKVQSESEDYVEHEAGQILEIMIDGDSIVKGGSVAIVPDAAKGRGEWMLYTHREEDDTLVSKQLGDTGYGYTKQQWYTAPLKTGMGVWSDPYIDKGAGECLMVTYSYPMKDADGNIFALLTADVALDDLDENLNRLIPYPQSYTFTMTKDGKVLSGYPQTLYDESDRGRGKNLDISAIFTSLEPGKTSVVTGKEFICTFTPIDNIDIVLATASPLKSVTSVTSQIRLPLLTIIVLGFVILIILLRFTMKRAMKPLNGLTQAAIEIGDGKFDTPLPDAPEYSDIDQLGKAMKYMEESINKYIAEIEESAKARERMASQLRIAREIQRSLLPKANESFSMGGGGKLILSAYQESAQEVGGDLYDYVETHGRLYFIIADVSGKGIPASLMMSYVKSLFHFAAQQNMPAADIVARINDNMCADNPNNMFVTMLVGYMQPEEHKMVIANAGHNPAVLCTAGACRYLELPAGLPVGVMPDMPYSETECTIGTGDTLFVYTDGMSEAENPDGVLFGQDRLIESVGNAVAKFSTPSEIVESLAEEIRQYSDNVYADDITMICISMPETPELILNLRYDVAEIDRLLAAVQAEAKRAEWSDSLLNNVMLAAEEAVVNVINYATPANNDDTVDFRLLCNDGAVEISVSDSGPEFDPLRQAPEVDTDLPLEERKVGGLGIFLIRSLAETVEYARKDGRNILKIKLKG